jgi:hypothetical protein
MGIIRSGIINLQKLDRGEEGGLLLKDAQFISQIAVRHYHASSVLMSRNDVHSSRRPQGLKPYEVQNIFFISLSVIDKSFVIDLHNTYFFFNSEI